MDRNVVVYIKGSAGFACAFGIVASLIVGSSSLVSGSAIGFLEIIIGAFFSWLSYIILYGFGKLIENSEIIAKSVSGAKKDTVPLKLNINKAITSEEKTENT